jgi:streptogramin lyase
MRPRVLTRFAIVSLVVAALAGLLGGARAGTAGEITQFFVGGIPADITAGADGNLWFTDSPSNQIVKMTSAGVMTRYDIPSFFSSPSSITRGADGNVWFAELNSNKIGRITPAGVITEFTVPTPLAGLYGGMTLGPDGNVWFAEGNSGKLGQITPAGLITEFPDIGAYDLAAGPDGNFWTVNPFSTAIGRVSTSGAATFFFPPVSGGTGGAITGGPDGNIWFTYVDGGGRIGKMTTSGTFVAGYPIPTNTSSLAITSGPDGNVWFGEWDSGKIARITQAGAITEYPVSGGRISGITTGPDGNIWFASRDGWVGNVQVLADTTPPTITVPSETTVNATSPNGATVSYQATATDDTDPNPTIACDPPSGSMFAIGSTVVSCTATDASGNRATASFTVRVKEAAAQLTDLYNAVVGVGPGTSLADKVTQARAYLNAQDRADTCETLDGFIAQARALSGQKIPAAVAASLISDAARIESVIGC